MIFKIEDFYRDGDGEDWLPAITRAMKEWRPNPQNLEDYRGFTLQFGSREYIFSGSIELIRGMSIIGSGGADAASVFKFPAGVHGIICHRKTTTPPGFGGGLADQSIVDRVKIVGGGSLTATAHGILMYARMTLTNTYITRFSGDGIHVEASVDANPPTNANNWQIQNCRVDDCNNGLFVKGSDANAGCAIALDCSDNREWGINDNSFLGNTYVACHTANNQGGAYRCTDRNAISLFLNCYSESGQTSEIGAPSIVLGGNMNVSGDAIWLSPSAFVANFKNSVRGESRQEPGKPVAAAYLGSVNMSGVALELHHVDPKIGIDAIPYRLHYSYQQPGWWELIFANLDGATPLRFSTQEASEGQANLWMQNGYFVGSGASRVYVNTGSEPPTSGNWQKGARIFNSDPIPGNPVKGYAGWICIESGSPGIWKGFGLIEQ